MLSLIVITRFLKSKHQKWEYYREEKQDFERLLIFLNIKVSAKSSKIELSEEFMAMWREEQTLCNVMTLYADKNEKEKNMKKMSDFSNYVLLQMQNLFSAYPGDS